MLYILCYLCYIYCVTCVTYTVLLVLHILCYLCYIYCVTCVTYTVLLVLHILCYLCYIYCNTRKVGVIIFSVFLTEPLLTSIKFSVFENTNTRQYTCTCRVSHESRTRQQRICVYTLPTFCAPLAWTIMTNCFSLYLSFTVHHAL